MTQHTGSGPQELSESEDQVEEVARFHTLLTQLLQDLDQDLPTHPVARPPDPARLERRLARRYDFSKPVPPEELLADVAYLLRTGVVQTTHPRYFGPFETAPSPLVVAGSALAARVNPQLATGRHAAAAMAIERHAVGFFLDRLGWRGEEEKDSPDAATGHFTGGGQESNLTAVLCALAWKFPEVPEHGLRSLPGDPMLYLSEEGHHSFEKAAAVAGLGRGAVRRVPVARQEAGSVGMDLGALREALAADRRAGRAPFLVAATVAATVTASVDPLPELATLCRREGLWLHGDAAWGGAALLSPRLAPRVAGIDLADSVTWDPHKTLPVPLGAGLFLTRHPETLEAAFAVEPGYLPSPSTAGPPDPYRSSLPWSRPFLGLGTFLALAEAGSAGLARAVERRFALGDRLRALLTAAGWTLVRPSPWPVVCFSHPAIDRGAVRAGAVARRINRSGEAWLTAVGRPRTFEDGAASDRARAPVHRAPVLRAPVLRATITGDRTSEADLDALVALLDRTLAEERATG